MWPVDKDINQRIPENGPTDRTNRTNSDVIVCDEPILSPAVTSPVPSVSHLNAYKSKVHLGTKIELHDGNIVKGRFIGLDLVHAKNSRRLRCSVAIFVCWTLIVAVGLTVYLVRVTMSKQTRLDLGIKESWYFRREDWQALKPFDIRYLSLPVKYVLIGHSATPYCNERFTCTKNILQIQVEHIQRGYGDIGPNFLVAGKGLIFEGRGANVVGAMVSKWNTRMISIMFLGDYTTDQADTLQFTSVNILLDYLLKNNVLEKDYILKGYCQIATGIYSPGTNIMNSMGNFTHWDPSNKDKCLQLQAI